MIFTEYIRDNKNQFINKVKRISQLLEINPNWLMAVMYSESRLNPHAVNPSGGATGLIQFMPATAKGLGTSTAALLRMNSIQQLDYVYKYYKKYAGKIKSFEDLYLINFFPIALGRPNNWVLQSSDLTPSVVARYNPRVDLNQDGKITVGEFKRSIWKHLPKEVHKKIKGQNTGWYIFGSATAGTLLALALHSLKNN